MIKTQTATVKTDSRQHSGGCLGENLLSTTPYLHGIKILPPNDEGLRKLSLLGLL